MAETSQILALQLGQLKTQRDRYADASEASFSGEYSPSGEYIGRNPAAVKAATVSYYDRQIQEVEARIAERKAYESSPAYAAEQRGYAQQRNYFDELKERLSIKSNGSKPTETEQALKMSLPSQFRNVSVREFLLGQSRPTSGYQPASLELRGAPLTPAPVGLEIGEKAPALISQTKPEDLRLFNLSTERGAARVEYDLFESKAPAVDLSLGRFNVRPSPSGVIPFGLGKEPSLLPKEGKAPYSFTDVRRVFKSGGEVFVFSAPIPYSLKEKILGKQTTLALRQEAKGAVSEFTEPFKLVLTSNLDYTSGKGGLLGEVKTTQLFKERMRFLKERSSEAVSLSGKEGVASLVGTVGFAKDIAVGVAKGERKSFFQAGVFAAGGELFSKVIPKAPVKTISGISEGTLNVGRQLFKGAPEVSVGRELGGGRITLSESFKVGFKRGSEGIPYASEVARGSKQVKAIDFTTKALVSEKELLLENKEKIIYTDNKAFQLTLENQPAELKLQVDESRPSLEGAYTSRTKAEVVGAGGGRSLSVLQQAEKGRATIRARQTEGVSFTVIGEPAFFDVLNIRKPSSKVSKTAGELTLGGGEVEFNPSELRGLVKQTASKTASEGIVKPTEFGQKQFSLSGEPVLNLPTPAVPLAIGVAKVKPVGLSDVQMRFEPSGKNVLATQASSLTSKLERIDESNLIFKRPADAEVPITFGEPTKLVSETRRTFVFDKPLSTLKVLKAIRASKPVEIGFNMKMGNRGQLNLFGTQRSKLVGTELTQSKGVGEVQPLSKSFESELEADVLQTQSRLTNQFKPSERVQALRLNLNVKTDLSSTKISFKPKVEFKQNQLVFNKPETTLISSLKINTSSKVRDVILGRETQRIFEKEQQKDKVVSFEKQTERSLERQREIQKQTQVQSTKLPDLTKIKVPDTFIGKSYLALPKARERFKLKGKPLRKGRETQGITADYFSRFVTQLSGRTPTTPKSTAANIKEFKEAISRGKQIFPTQEIKSGLVKYPKLKI